MCGRDCWGDVHAVFSEGIEGLLGGQHGVVCKGFVLFAGEEMLICRRFREFGDRFTRLLISAVSRVLYST